MTDENECDQMNGAIVLEAFLYRITTTVDGGWNITFSADQTSTESILALSKFRNKSLQFAIVPLIDNN